MTNYYWICGLNAGNILAENMKDACVKSIIAQLPEGEETKINIFEMKVLKGILPKYWPEENE